MHKRGWLQWVILSLAIVLLSSHAVTPALASNARPILVNCGAVYTVDPDGSHRNLVFREIWNTRPVLSPAGQLIAWSMAPYHSYARIEMVNVDGSGRHEITNGQLNGQNFYAQNPA
ncbi:MAG TPA: hypothetical protein VMT34_10525 [Aggregatilineales bacterium]|nr:hypothetical protein [Aggregatilineales bacterium]